MLRKILLSSILILAVGCEEKSIKNGVYRGVINGENREFVINKNKLDYIDLKYNTTNYYSKINDKNEDDKDIVYYITETKMSGREDKWKSYIGVKQTNDNSIIIYGLHTSQYDRDIKNAILSYYMGYMDIDMFNALTTIYSIDINSPSIFEKVEE